MVDGTVSQAQEAKIQEQALLMLARNIGKININTKIIKRMIKCIYGYDTTY
jgi:hypothetical protein